MNQQQLYEQIDIERRLYCALCTVGIPGGGGALSHHHIVTKGELGKNEKLLQTKSNVAIACQRHHDLMGHSPFRGLWALANIKLKYAEREDYTAIDVDEWQLGEILLGECIGCWGDGNEFFEDFNGTQTMAILQTARWGREDKRIYPYCEMLCPHAQNCITVMREILNLQIKSEVGK